MYLPGVPWQFQVMVPLAVSNVGVTVMVTAWPVLVAAVEPFTVMVPPAFTVEAETLPTTGMTTPEPALAVSVGLVWNFSEIAVRAEEAARISSDTLARTV